MEAILSRVDDPSELLNLSDARLPYRFDQIFHAKGFGARRLAKNRLKLVKELDGQVQRMLAETERVEFVSWGIEYSLLEHYLMGAWSLLINRRAIVFTDRRILLIQINSRRKVKELKSQIRYNAIERVARDPFGHLKLMLRDGKKLVVTGIPRKDRKVIRERVAAKVEETRADAPALGRDHLCPACGVKVMGFPERCKQCARGFKSARRAGWLSLILPGLGDWYLGHRALGVMEMIGAVAAWAVLVVPLLLPFGDNEPAYLEASILAVLVFAFVHGVDSWVTRRVGFKGIYPEA